MPDGMRDRGEVMRIFLSYSHQDSRTADEVQLALLAEGHTVFFDRSGLPPGAAFHASIRREIAAADAFVFLLSPLSIRPGCYALSELKLASAKWPSPGGHVLPVRVAPTPSHAIPPYLMAVTILEPAGNVAAETADAIAKLLRPSPVAENCAPRVLTHLAVFDGLPTRPALFINVTNLSPTAPCEITHVWLETEPKAHVLRRERTLPTRLRPQESWETWLFLDELPAHAPSDLFNSARVRLSTGQVLASQRNESVPDQGFVPGAIRR